MPTMEIHQRTIRRGVYVHNAGELVFVAYPFVIKNTRKSSELSPVWASLWNWWEDLCKQVPGEEKVKLFFGSLHFDPFAVTFFPWKAHADGIGVQCRGECPCSTDGELFFFKRGCVLSSFNWNVNWGWFMFPHRILFAKTLKKHHLLKIFVPEKHCNPMTPRTPCNSYIVWNISFWHE